MGDIGQLPGQQYYCRLKINDVEYSSQNIVNLTIREWVYNILPILELSILDDGFLINQFSLQDNDIISLLIAKNNSTEVVLNLKFQMSDYNITIVADNRKSIVNITGFLKVDNMFTIKSKSFLKSNSEQVLQQVSTDVGLIFSNPRKVVPSDNMTWYQSTQSNYDFISHVLKRSFIPNDVIFSYANTENKFIYTSLKKELDKKNYRIARYSVQKFADDFKDENDTDDSIWYSHYDIVNYNGYVNKTVGYGVSVQYYDLKTGQKQVYSDIIKSTDLSFRDKKYAGTETLFQQCCDLNLRNYYGDDYFISPLRNKMLKDTYFAFSIVLNINSYSKVSLFDKIQLQLESSFDGDINNVMSGNYLIGGIIHNIQSNGIYRKMISLHRSGMNKSPNIQMYGVEV